MQTASLAKATMAQIETAVKRFESKRSEFDLLAKNLLSSLTENDTLRPLIHSTKLRTKDPDHLRHKLERIALQAINQPKPFNIDESNLFTNIDDLAGVRLLHLHTKQMLQINPAIQAILDEFKYKLVKKPVAYTWDIENKRFFEQIGIRTVHRDTLYTSVHYVVEANRRTKMRCEIQVRTLMEEVWSEVSHNINYPHETESLACKEQLNVLARIASGCTRLVDSIYASYDEHKRTGRNTEHPPVNAP